MSGDLNDAPKIKKRHQQEDKEYMTSWVTEKQVMDQVFGEIQLKGTFSSNIQYSITWPSKSDEHASLTLVFAPVCVTYLSRLDLNFLFTLHLQTFRFAGITFD